MAIKSFFRGVDNFLKNLEKAQKGLLEQAAKALLEEGKIELKEMKRRTPVETGELVDSGQIDNPEIKGGKVSVAIHFDAPHAVFVHEDLDAFHSVGQAKFMESVLNESAPYMAKRVAKRIDLKKAVR